MTHADRLTVLCVPVVLLACSLCPAAAQMIAPQAPDTAKTCAICHLQWTYPFYKENRDGELVAKPDTEQVATQAMCLSCHDGSVMDDRRRVFNGAGHATGTIPPDTMALPATFPLDRQGRITCGTCHTPHALPGSEQHRYGPFLRTANIDSAICQACHPGKATGAASGNHSLARVDTPAAPYLHTSGARFAQTEPSQMICETCHIAHGGTEPDKLVLAVQPGGTAARLCEACHQRQNATRATGFATPRSHPNNHAPRRLQLPATWPAGTALLAAGTATITCTVCHHVHQGRDTQALLPMANTGDAMCRHCHQDQDAVIGTSHDLRVSAAATLNRAGTKARATGPCGSCHLVHQGTGPLLWSAAMPAAGRHPADGVCLGCHGPQGCAGGATTGINSHPLGAGTAAESPDARLPRYSRTLVTSEAGTVRCLTCHAVHTPVPLHVTQEHDWRSGAFLRAPGRESIDGLCTTCHRDYDTLVGSGHDLGTADRPYRNERGENPAASGICGMCHAVHNAPRSYRLWVAPWGPAIMPHGDNGTPAGPALRVCTGCHRPDGLAGADTLPYGLHPGGERFSLLRIERLSGGTAAFPLYAANGADAAVGMIACGTCHDPHRPADSCSTPQNCVSFVRPGLDSQLCVICHGDDSLLKLKYFHRARSRMAEPAAFPWGAH